MKKIVIKYLFLSLIFLGMSSSILSMGRWECPIGTEYEEPSLIPVRNFGQAIRERTLQEKLYKDIKEGKIEQVKQDIKEGADLNTKGEFILGQTPLDIAIKEAGNAFYRNSKDKDIRLKILELLLQNKANVNGKGQWDWTPLERALNPSNPKLPIVKMLLRYGANIFHKDKRLNITLLEYAKTKNPEIKNLLENYHNLLQKVLTNPNKQTLHDAIKDDYHLIVRRFIRCGMPVDDSDLALAKQYDSKMSGPIILNQLKLTGPQGRISRTGLCPTGLPPEVLEHIGRLSH